MCEGLGQAGFFLHTLTTVIVCNMYLCLSQLLSVYIRRNLMSFIFMHLKTINVTLFLQGQTAAVINLCHLSECLMLENSFSNESHLLHCVSVPFITMETVV